jgi:hypothetical protein
MNAPGAGAEVIVERRLSSGRTVALGPRGLLDLDEAAEVLDRPRDQVLRAIRAGFLRARRRGGRVSVTLGACLDFLREEEEDRRLAQARKREPTIPVIVARHAR